LELCLGCNWALQLSIRRSSHAFVFFSLLRTLELIRWLTRYLCLDVMRDLGCIVELCSFVSSIENFSTC